MRIRRQENAQAESYWQTFEFEPEERMRVLDLLALLNEREHLVDIEGNEASPIRYAQSCGVRKCGACAMVVNGVPCLACATFVGDTTGDTITLEPLSKFPLVGDLMVDRGYIEEALVKMEVWQHGPATHGAKTYEYRFASASCIHCGCCMEACPNFDIGKDFLGSAISVNAVRVLDQIRDRSERRAYRHACHAQLTNPCSHALTCEAVCPIDIPVTRMIAYLNGK